MHLDCFLLNWVNIRNIWLQFTVLGHRDLRILSAH